MAHPEPFSRSVLFTRLGLVFIKRLEVRTSPLERRESTMKHKSKPNRRSISVKEETINKTLS